MWNTLFCIAKNLLVVCFFHKKKPGAFDVSEDPRLKLKRRAKLGAPGSRRVAAHHHGVKNG